MMLLDQKVLKVPEGVAVSDFIINNGQVDLGASAVPAVVDRNGTVPVDITLGELKKKFVEAYSAGAMEKNSLDTVAMHFRHLIKTLGVNFSVQTLTLAMLQEHVNRRAKKKGIRNRPLSPATIRKEIASFRAAWNWAVQMGLVTGNYPNRGLKFPKAEEKPPFQTRQEIERQVARGVTEAEERDLWDCLFLTLPDIAELLQFVKDGANHPFIYPMFCFAAHTGARRSEMLRARINDVDLEAKTT